LGSICLMSFRNNRSRLREDIMWNSGSGDFL
jgi:hypothetical protein